MLKESHEHLPRSNVRRQNIRCEVPKPTFEVVTFSYSAYTDTLKTSGNPTNVVGGILSKVTQSVI
jgi:hypothetical protein